MLSRDATGNGLGMGRTACRMGVCSWPGRFRLFRSFSGYSRPSIQKDLLIISNPLHGKLSACNNLAV